MKICIVSRHAKPCRPSIVQRAKLMLPSFTATHTSKGSPPSLTVFSSISLAPTLCIPRSWFKNGVQQSYLYEIGHGLSSRFSFRAKHIGRAAGFWLLKKRGQVTLWATIDLAAWSPSWRYILSCRDTSSCHWSPFHFAVSPGSEFRNEHSVNGADLTPIRIFFTCPCRIG